MMDMLKMPQWIKTARKGADTMSDDTVMLPPPIATLPEPEFTAHDEELSLMQRAAVLHAQLRRTIDTAKVELAEAVLARQGDAQKIEAVEKENAELRVDNLEKDNTITSMQLELTEKNKVLSLLQQVLDRMNIKAPPKKERKPKAPKPEMQEATPETEAG